LARGSPASDWAVALVAEVEDGVEAAVEVEA
jgi:hypothetical protein